MKDFFVIIAATFLNGEWDSSFATWGDNSLTETFQTLEACETRLVERWQNNNPPPPFPDKWEGSMEKNMTLLWWLLKTLDKALNFRAVQFMRRKQASEGANALTIIA